MSCEPYSISCRLDEIVQALRSPTDVEVLTLAVAAVSALGTLLIAGLNFWLLWRQHALAAGMREDQTRAKRNRFASALKDWGFRIISSRVSGLPLDPEEQDRLMTNAMRLNEEIDDSTHPRPTTWMLRTVRAETFKKGDFERAMELQNLVIEVLDQWVVDPNLVPESPNSEAALS